MSKSKITEQDHKDATCWPLQQITADELRAAFEQFKNVNAIAINYTRDPRIVDEMAARTGQNRDLSAGCETGIKLGLLIAAARAALRETEPAIAQVKP